MEIITKGSLENISRPASSSERACSRVSSGSLSLIALTDEAPHSQEQGGSQENTTINFTGQLHADVTDGDNGSELQKAFEEMQRLDDILAAKVHKEKEVKAQGRDLKEKLWLELLNKREKSSECATEAENTRLFLALATVSGAKEEGDFEPVFGTQVPENEYDWDSRHQEQCDRELGGMMMTMVRSSGLGQEEKEPDRCEDSYCGAPRSKKNQPDFVKKNIQLASGAGSHALTMSQTEKQRLTELLGGAEEDEEENEEEDSAVGADSEVWYEDIMETFHHVLEEDDVWAVWVPPGQGYTPEPSSMEQLIHIDSTLHLLRSAEGFLHVPSCYNNPSTRQSMSPPALSEDQLHTLLHECMLTHTEETWDMTPRGPESDRDTEGHQSGEETWDMTPRGPESDRDTEGHHQSLTSLSEAVLSELLTDEYTTSFSRPDNNVCERSITAGTQPLHSEERH